MTRHHHAATATAVLALTVSLSGVAYAAGKISTKDIKNEAVTSKKIKDGTIKQRDLSDATVAALSAPSVRAYGVVSDNDVTFVANRTSGLATVTRPSTGVYCLTLSDDTIDPSTIAPIVSVDYGRSAGGNLHAYVDPENNVCPAGSDFSVLTFQFGPNNAPSDFVAFTVLVP